MLASFITYIGPWTFLYGLFFCGLAIGADFIRRALGIGILMLGLLLLKDIPGTFFASSLYILFQLRPQVAK